MADNRMGNVGFKQPCSISNVTRYDNMKAGYRYKMYITCIEADNGTRSMTVWGQLDTPSALAIEKVMANMESHLNKGNGKVQSEDIVVGTMCCAKFADDQKWYRARVEDRPTARNNLVRVTFVDFGNMESIPLSDLRILETSLFDLPPCACKFVMANVGSQDINWSMEALDFVRSKLCYEEVTVGVVGKVGKFWAIKVYLGDANTSFNREFVSIGLACDNNNILYQLSPKSKPGGNDSLANALNLQLVTGTGYSVMIVHVEGQDSFWIQTMEHVKQFEFRAMEIGIGIYCKNLLRGKNCCEVSLGVQCLASNKLKQHFARGRIVDIMETEATVLFVDYGNRETLSKLDIFPMPDPYQQQPSMAIHCTLGELKEDLSKKEVANTLCRLSKILITCYCTNPFPENKFHVRLFTEIGDVFLDSISLRSDVRYRDIEVQPGSRYRVLVSHVSEPSMFFVQIEEYWSMFNVIMSALQRSLVDETKLRCLELEYIGESTPCAVRCVETHKWYRGRVITSVDNRQYKIFFVDTGQYELKDATEVFAIAPELVSMSPALAITCGLHQIGPDTSVSKVGTGEFCAMVRDKTLSLEVVEARSMGVQMVNLYDHLASPPILINLVVRHRISNKKSKVVVPAPKIEPVESLYVMTYESSSDFFGQLTRMSLDPLNEIIESMTSYYSDLNSDEQLLCDDGNSHVGEYCCAQYHLDRKFYRAKIVSHAAHKVRLLFVDYGNTETVDTCDVKVLHAAFASYPAFGFRCSLENTFTHVRGEYQDAVRDILVDRTVEVEVVPRSDDDVCDVTITDSPQNTDLLNKLKLFAIVPRTPASGASKLLGKKCGQQSGPDELEEAVLAEGEETSVTVSFFKSPLQFWCQLSKYSVQFHEMSVSLENLVATSHPPPLANIRVGAVGAGLFQGLWYRAVIKEVVAPTDIEIFFIDYGNSSVVHPKHLLSLPPSCEALPKQAVECQLADVAVSEFKVPLLSSMEEALIDNIFQARIKKRSPETRRYSIELIDVHGENVARRFGLLPSPAAPAAVPSRGNAASYGSATNEDTFLKGGPAPVLNASKQPAAAFNGYKDCGLDEGWDEAPSTKAKNDVGECERDARGFGQRSDSRDGGGRDSGRGGCVFGRSGIGADGDGGGGYQRFVPPRMQREQSERSDSQSDNWRKGLDSSDSRSFQYDRSSLQDGQSRSDGGANAKNGAQLVPAEIVVGPKDLRGVKVSFAVNPSQFYCQLMSVEPAFAAMDKGLQSYYSSNKCRPVTGSIQPCTACCAKFSEDGRWYRAVVSSCSGTQEVQVHFIDYGNSETAPVSDLKVLESEFARVPMMAVRCSLHNVRARTGGCDWTESEAASFEAQVLDKLIGARFLSSDCSGGGGVTTYAVQLFTSSLAEDALLNCQLIRDGFALPVNPNDRIYKKLVCDRMLIPIVEPKPRVGQKESVTISWVTSLGMFFCQFTSRAPDLERLMSDLEAAHSGGSGAPLSMFAWNAVCVALYKEEEFSSWCRALVLDSDAANALVYYLDYGNVGYVPKSEIKEIGTEYLETPIQAVLCTFCGVQPLQGDWPLLENEALQSYFTGTTFECVFHGKRGASFLVDLIVDGQNVAERLVSDGLVEERAESDGSASDVANTDSYPACEELANGFHDVTVCSVANLNLFWCRLCGHGELAEEFGRVLQESPSLEALCGCPKLGLAVAARREADGPLSRAAIKSRKGPLDFEVVFVDSGDEAVIRADELKLCCAELVRRPCLAFPCTLTGLAEDLSEENHARLFDVVAPGRPLKAHVDGRTFGVHSLTLFKVDDNDGVLNLNSFIGLESTVEYSPDKICLPDVPFAESGQTVEVVVSTVVSPLKFYVQKSSCEAELAALSDRLNASYEGSSPNVDVPPWTVGSLCVGQYSEDQLWYRASVLEVFDDGDLQVVFVDYGNEERIPLSAIHQILPEFGTVAAFSARCAIDQRSLPDGIVSDEFQKIFVEMTGDGADVFAARFLRCDGSTCVVSLSNTAGVDVIALAGGMLTAASDMTFPELDLTCGHKVEVFTTSIVSPAEFWIQRAEDGSRIDELAERLAEIYEGSSAENRPAFGGSVGDVCAAMFSTDGLFYRGLVVGAAKGGFLVRFVDYGNSETVVAENVLELDASLIEFPRFAVECCLRGVKMPPDGVHSESAVKAFQELVANGEKKLLAEVLERTCGGRYVVSLLDMGIDLTVALVDSGVVEGSMSNLHHLKSEESTEAVREGGTEPIDADTSVFEQGDAVATVSADDGSPREVELSSDGAEFPEVQIVTLDASEEDSVDIEQAQCDSSEEFAGDAEADVQREDVADDVQIAAFVPGGVIVTLDASEEDSVDIEQAQCDSSEEFAGDGAEADVQREDVAEDVQTAAFVPGGVSESHVDASEEGWSGPVDASYSCLDTDSANETRGSENRFLDSEESGKRTLDSEESENCVILHVVEDCEDPILDSEEWESRIPDSGEGENEMPESKEMANPIPDSKGNTNKCPNSEGGEGYAPVWDEPDNQMSDSEEIDENHLLLNSEDVENQVTDSEGHDNQEPYLMQPDSRLQDSEEPRRQTLEAKGSESQTSYTEERESQIQDFEKCEIQTLDSEETAAVDAADYDRDGLRPGLTEVDEVLDSTIDVEDEDLSSGNGTKSSDATLSPSAHNNEENSSGGGGGTVVDMERTRPEVDPDIGTDGFASESESLAEISELEDDDKTGCKTKSRVSSDVSGEGHDHLEDVDVDEPVWDGFVENLEPEAREEIPSLSPLLEGDVKSSQYRKGTERGSAAVSSDEVSDGHTSS